MPQGLHTNRKKDSSDGLPTKVMDTRPDLKTPSPELDFSTGADALSRHSVSSKGQSSVSFQSEAVGSMTSAIPSIAAASAGIATLSRKIVISALEVYNHLKTPITPF